MKAIKSLAAAALVALVAAPALSFAQTSQGVTRAQVRAELTQLRQAGYDPSSDQTQYPQNIQAALARIHAGDAVAQSAYGAGMNGTSDAGKAMLSASSAQDTVPGLGAIYKNP
jgi:opacity protein-like surface antigen